MTAKYDLFISYAHADDQGAHAGKVTAIRDWIAARHEEAFPNDPLDIFFDTASLVVLDHWKSKIFTGLEQSAVMVAILSPNYFNSDWCRREWQAFTELELQRTYPGEAISPIYVIEHPDFDMDEARITDAWLRDLKNRQYLEWKPFWSEGLAALGRREVQQRLSDLHDSVWRRVQQVRQFRKQPWNVPAQTARFVGRENDLEELNQALMTRQTVGLVAINGLGGVGKTTLAFRLAQRFRDHYPGGVLQASCENVKTDDDLREVVYSLARDHLFRTDELSLPLAEATRLERMNLIADWSSGDDKRRAKALQVAVARFTTGERKLLILDNVVDAAIVQPAPLKKLIPCTDILRLLITSRLAASELPGIACRRVDVLDAKDGLELLARGRWFSRNENDPQATAASEAYQRYCAGEITFDEATLSADDGEWKAAAAIVRRVGGLTIALEVIGVDLYKNPEISYHAYMQGLIRKGLLFKLDESGARAAGEVDAAATLMSELYAPTLDRLPPLARRILEYAACLPKDAVPLQWIRQLVENDPDVEKSAKRPGDDEPDPVLESLRLLDGEQLLHNTQGASGGEPFPMGRMHQILQEVMQRRLGTERRAAREEVVAALVDDLTYGVQNSILLPEVLAVVDALRAYIWPRLDGGQAVVGRAAIMVAQLLARRGDIRAADRCSSAAVKLLEARADSTPENADYAHELCVAYVAMGQVLQALGDNVQARASYEKALAIAERLVAGAPENAVYAWGLSVSYEQMGTLFQRFGEGAQARAFFEKALAVRVGLPAGAPDYAHRLSVSYVKMGDVLLWALGDSVQARVFYEKDLAIAEGLAAGAPENSEYAFDLSVSCQKMGEVLQALGDNVQARAFYEKGLAIAERQAAGAPEDAVYASFLSISYHGLGDVLDASGESVQARAFYEKSLAIDVRQSDRAPENADCARALGIGHDRLFCFFKEHGQFDEAIPHLVGFLKAWLPLSERGALPDPEDQEILRSRLEIARKLGLLNDDDTLRDTE